MTQLLTNDEAADYLKLTPRQVLRLANRGELPSVAFPNREIRFDAADLAQFVEAHKRPTGREGSDAK
jgi:excisionase family DNA binding protein